MMCTQPASMCGSDCTLLSGAWAADVDYSPVQTR